MLIFVIVLAILAVVAFGVFTVLAKTTGKDADPEDYRVNRLTKLFKKLRIIVSGALVVIIALTMLISGVRIIDSTEIGVVRTFGEINRQIDSGLNFVNPISDTVTNYDLRVHVREASFMSYTKDAQPLTAAIEYQYKLNPASVMKVAQEFGSYEILETKLENVVQEKAKIVCAKYSAMTLLENRAILSAQVAEEVKDLEELYHIQFSSVIVKDIDFSDAFEQSVEAKMTAEQDALRAEQEKKTAIVKAEQAKEVARLEAEALEITRQALQNMPEAWITQQYLEKWNGELPQIVSDGSNLMFTPNLEE